MRLFENRALPSFELDSVQKSFHQIGRISRYLYLWGEFALQFLISLFLILKKRLLHDHLIVSKYYCPNIQIDLTKTLFKYANTSIDISDGLIVDLEKMINKQNLSYKINLNDVPISKNLLDLIKIIKLNKSNLISQGDDYQILFSASPTKARIIHHTSKNLGIKITKIGKITLGNKKSIIIDQKGKQILIKNKGYTHQF